MSFHTSSALRHSAKDSVASALKKSFQLLHFSKKFLEATNGVAIATNNLYIISKRSMSYIGISVCKMQLDVRKHHGDANASFSTPGVR